MSTSTIIMIAAIIYYLVIPSLKARTIPLKRLIITPIIFMYFFYQSLNTDFHSSSATILFSSLGVMTGIVIGMWTQRNTLVEANHEKQMIHLPGTYVSLIVFTLLFSIHYWIDYHEANNPDYFVGTTICNMAILFSYAVFSSISAGSNLLLYYKFTTSATKPVLGQPA